VKSEILLRLLSSISTSTSIRRKLSTSAYHKTRGKSLKFELTATGRFNKRTHRNYRFTLKFTLKSRFLERRHNSACTPCSCMSITLSFLCCCLSPELRHRCMKTFLLSLYRMQLSYMVVQKTDTICMP